MKSEKIKAKSRPHSPGHYLGAASASPAKTGKKGETHPLDGKTSSIIGETVSFWTKRTGKKLSQDEVMEAIVNISGFFETLLGWNCKIQKEDTHAEALTSFHTDRRIRGGKRTQ